MRWLISIPLLVLLTGCTDFGYYWNSANGHLAVMQQRVYIDDMLADDTLDPGLRERLLLVKQIRRYAIEHLDLSANGSYRSYVDLQRPWVVQNLFAANEFSTHLQQWCYPLVGCASYRGYYDAEKLQAYAAELRAQGLEVHVSQVPAYSTLGWFDDPVLSSFIDWPDYRLAGLLFHELTHQQVFVDGDTTFNESLATAVEQVGTQMWLLDQRRYPDLAAYLRWQTYRAEVIELILSTRSRLAELYANEIDKDRIRHRKALEFDAARAEHTAIAARHGIVNGFKTWFAGELNNAKFGSIAAYTSRVSAFENMLDHHADDFSGFYRYVKRVAALDREQRERCLDAWQSEVADALGTCPTGDA